MTNDQIDTVFKFIAVLITFSLTISLIPAQAIPGDVELSLTDIWIKPDHPQKGNKVTLYGDVFNAGTWQTNKYANFFTTAFFIDGKLINKTRIDNVLPGARHDVVFSTGPVWNATWGNHNMTVVVNYDHTIPNLYDNPANNVFTKFITVEPVIKTRITVETYPKYIIPYVDKIITINGSLDEFNSNKPISNQNAVLTMGDSTNYITTDKNGKFTTTKAIAFSNQNIPINVYFGGKFPYLASRSSNYIITLPASNDAAALTLKIKDAMGHYNFNNLPSDIIVLQDSNSKVYTKVLTGKNGTLVDKNTVLINVPGNHSYLERVYVHGRLIFSTHFDKIPIGSVLQKNINIPKTAQIKFHVTDKKNMPLNGVLIKNWVYSAKTDKTGYTGWITVLPTTNSKEPYIATGSTNGKSLKSGQFFIASGEKKIINVKEL